MRRKDSRTSRVSHRIRARWMSRTREFHSIGIQRARDARKAKLDSSDGRYQHRRKEFPRIAAVPQ